MIKAGELQHQIVIETYTEQQDVIGQIDKTWATLVTVRAKIDEFNGRESDEEGILVGITMADVIIRKDTSNAITQKMRVNYAGFYWDILSVLEYGNLNEGYKLKIRKRDNDPTS